MKRQLFVIIISLLLIFTIMPVVNSEDISDEINDIIHVYWQNQEFNFEVVTRDHIDIINANFTVDEEILYLEMSFLANISMNNNFSYSLLFGNHSFYYLYGEVYNSSSFINYEINDNTLQCIFELNDNENISNYMLFGHAGEIYDNESWYDLIPDLYPPWLIYFMGAGRVPSSFGRGFTLSAMNVHDSKTVKCSLSVFYEGLFGIRKPIIGPYNITLPPGGSDYIRLINNIHILKPFICDVTVAFTIENATIYMIGYSIAQWYFITGFQIDIEQGRYYPTNMMFTQRIFHPFSF
jgi:hypothetical protein